VSRYQKGKTNLDFTEARDSEWQWHQLGHMQVCTWLQTDNHTSTPPLCFLQAGCPSCRPTNSVKALKLQQSMHNLVTRQFTSTESDGRFSCSVMTTDAAPWPLLAVQLYLVKSSLCTSRMCTRLNTVNRSASLTDSDTVYLSHETHHF